MSFLRSHLFIAIVSLFVLTGYGYAVFGDCCPHHEQSQMGPGQTAPNDQTPDGEDDCQCICQKIVAPLTLVPLQVADALFVPAAFMAPADEFPPDAVPLGIDYPPQLA